MFAITGTSSRANHRKTWLETMVQSSLFVFGLRFMHVFSFSVLALVVNIYVGCWFIFSAVAAAHISGLENLGLKKSF